jgi:hypothetical protein
MVLHPELGSVRKWLGDAVGLVHVHGELGAPERLADPGGAAARDPEHEHAMHGATLRGRLSPVAAPSTLW